jgi:hypothetical protein
MGANYKMDKEISKNSFKKRLCPLVKEPTDDCYCMKHDNQSIQRMIYYCGGDFEKCEIYETVIAKRQKKEN